jgi:hypothetical protein
MNILQYHVNLYRKVGEKHTRLTSSWSNGDGGGMGGPWGRQTRLQSEIISD